MALPCFSTTAHRKLNIIESVGSENVSPRANNLPVASLKAVMDTSNTPLATVRSALTVILVGGGSTISKSAPVDVKKI